MSQLLVDFNDEQVTIQSIWSYLFSESLKEGRHFVTSKVLLNTMDFMSSSCAIIGQWNIHIHIQNSLLLWLLHVAMDSKEALENSQSLLWVVHGFEKVQADCGGDTRAFQGSSELCLCPVQICSQIFSCHRAAVEYLYKESPGNPEQISLRQIPGFMFQLACQF